jgi:hypothetical protein
VSKYAALDELVAAVEGLRARHGALAQQGIPDAARLLSTSGTADTELLEALADGV